MQTTFKKNYIGKGRPQQAELFGSDSLVKVTLKMSQAQSFIFEKDGEKYLSFQIAKMKKADDFGRTHTCYVSTKEAEAQAEIGGTKKSKK